MTGPGRAVGAVQGDCAGRGKGAWQGWALINIQKAVQARHGAQAARRGWMVNSFCVKNDGKEYRGIVCARWDA